MASPLLPWRIEDAGVDSVIEAACAGTRALPLTIPDRLADGFPIDKFVAIDFEIGDWAPKDFPFTDATSRRVGLQDFPRLIKAVRDDAVLIFGEGFDRPGGKVVRPAPLVEKR